jgi:hypothetical protein
MLISWFHDPKKYQWMSIEGNKELGHIKSLDDIICFTATGEYELYQVKFTTDSDRDDLLLDFDWLLKKKKNGTSLIEKWSADIEKFGASNIISIAQLITNRKPDTVLSNCLDGNRIDYNLIPDEIKSKISNQLGNENKAILFFKNLIFEHSQQKIDDLEKKLYDSLVPDHATDESWFQLLKTVERWATRKNEPTPGSRIFLENIYEILSLGSKRTISQFFEVPGGYIPPTDEFHKQILERTAKSGCLVISGLPGMGKSTYLSFLTDQLIEDKTPVIRHHYYLSPQFIGDRIAFNNAAQSLQSQIKTLYPFDFDSDKLDPQQLETWLNKAADKAAESDEILVVIIDGLDHVYRERSDISQLEHLINRIEPVKDRICLLFGTQPISDENLPNSLLRSAPRENSWIDIPAMGLDSIKSRIDFLVSIEEIDVVGDDDHKQSEIVEISQALLDISHGYPLHIIYSLNSLMLEGKKVSKYDVESLPACPDGDIHVYYENLWISLSASAKEILLLIANADFSWPNKTHISYCFEDSLTFQKSFSEIQHLIEQRLSGITAFHGSLFIYIKRKDGYAQSRDRLNRISQIWINQHAPEYWKWGWEWIIEANLGNTNSLLQGITREWLIQSLCKGYPLEHIQHIFNVAEHITFGQKLYPELLRLRILKMRLLNGPEFQIQDFSDFLDCSLNCSQNTFGLLWRADNLRIISDNEIVIVAKHFQGRDERIVNACAKEIYRRINFYARLEDNNHYQTLNSLVDGYLQVLVSYDNPDLNRINKFFERLTDKSSSLNRIIELLIQYGHRHLLLDLPSFDIPEDISSRLVDEIVLAASIEGFIFDEATASFSSSNSYIKLLYLFLDGKDIQIEKLEELACPDDYETATYHLFYKYFLNTLVFDLINPNELEIPQLNKPANIQEFLKNIWQTFQFTSSSISADFKAGKRFEIVTLYDYFNILELPDQFHMGYQINAVLFNIRKSLAKIAIHLNILCNSIDDFSTLNKKQFTMLKESIWWDSRVFLDVAAKNSIFNFSKEAISQEFIKLFEVEIYRRDDTASLANDSIELAKLACDHGLHDEAGNFLKRAALNIVGYGYRKDITLHEVFEAIQECSDSNCPEVPNWLRRVATFTTDVFDFSEKEIRHIPGWFTKLLSKHNPERLVDELEYYLVEENWHRTNLIIENIVKSFPLTTQSEHSFLRCMTTFDALTALKGRAEGNSVLKRIYDEQCNVLGGMPPPPRESSSTEDEDTPEYPDVSTLQPDNLEEFRTTLCSISYRIRKTFLSDWITYWVEQNQGVTILNSFNKYYEQEKSDYELDECLHNIFLLSKKIEGKTKAYKWAVRNIKLNNCWNRYTYSQAEESLREYGATYNKEWENILHNTMAPGSSRLQKDENIIVPSTQLVTYLVSAGQVDLAAQITEVMVRSLEEDIAHLPLTELYWYEQPVSLEATPLHLIYLHYKWPDRYARLLTAKQIAVLLQDDANIEFRSLYLQYLSKQPYEIDIVDYLSILSLLKDSLFTREEITANIHYSSLVSNKILLTLGLIDKERNDFKTLYSKFSDNLVPNRAKYDRYSNGIALRFIGVIKELEKEHKIPLVKHFLLEWEQIQERHPCYIFDPYDFCRDQFYPQDKISCSFSWAAETSVLSAYVRTLAYAIDKHAVSAEVCLMYAQEVLPFGSVAINLSPSNPPVSWPRLKNLMKGDPLPGQDELEQYLSHIADSDEILLYANGPVLRNHTGICLDIKVILVSLKDAEIYDPESMFDSINYLRNAEESIFPLAKWTWSSSFGRWEIDWLSRGYFQPTYSVGDLPINTITQNESSVEYFGGNISNGIWRYWINQWYPVHQIGVGNSFGTYMTVSKNFLSKFKENIGGDYYLIAEMTCVDKREFIHNQEPIKTFAILPT